MWGLPASLVLLLASGCERNVSNEPQNQQTRTYSVIMVGPAASHPQSRALAGGARIAADRHGNTKLEFSTPDGATSEALGRAVRAALDLKPDAVCLWVASPETVEPVLPGLIESNVLVVTMGTSVPNSSFFGHVDANIQGGAEMLGERLDVIADGGRSYVLLHEAGTNTLATQCRDRFNYGIRQHYGVQLLDERNAGSTTTPAHELVREMVTRFPNVAMVITFSADAWLAAPPAETLGPRTRFATMPATPELWPWLRSGQAAALVGPIDGQIGELAVEMAMTGLTSDRREGGGTRVVRAELVNARNLEDFAGRYAAAAGSTPEELGKAPAIQAPASAPR